MTEIIRLISIFLFASLPIVFLIGALIFFTNKKNYKKLQNYYKNSILLNVALLLLSVTVLANILLNSKHGDFWIYQAIVFAYFIVDSFKNIIEITWRRKK